MLGLYSYVFWAQKSFAANIFTIKSLHNLVLGHAHVVSAWKLSLDNTKT